VSEVKVDASFVTKLFDVADNELIVRSLVGLVRALGIRSVAEGVETAEVAAALRAMGCDAAQGWCFSRPLEPAAASQWLASHLPGPARERAREGECPPVVALPPQARRPAGERRRPRSPVPPAGAPAGGQVAGQQAGAPAG
jgi:hypothetical protein